MFWVVMFAAWAAGLYVSFSLHWQAPFSTGMILGLLLQLVGQLILWRALCGNWRPWK